jgi:hypothetical protein
MRRCRDAAERLPSRVADAVAQVAEVRVAAEQVAEVQPQRPKPARLRRQQQVAAVVVADSPCKDCR